MSRREEVRRLASESIDRGDALSWFEDLYRSAAGDWSRIPWADLVPNPYLVLWLRTTAARACGSRALVVGCGLGDDAEALAAAGLEVVAFDISPTAIDACVRRFPCSRVEYTVADLLAAPAGWIAAYDLVFESYTLQVLPPPTRADAARALAALVAPGGKLLVLCRGRERSEAAGELPWPLTRDELDALARHGLREISFQDFADDSESPPVRRFLALYDKPRA